MQHHRAFTAVAALVVTASSLSAQGMSWGPMLGLSQTTLTNVVSAEYRTGVTVGAQFRSDRRDASTFWTAGIAYSARGAAVPNAGVSGNMVLNYLELPLFKAWNISIENPWITPYIDAGAQLSIKLSCIVTGGTPSKSLNCDDPVFGLVPVKFAAYDLSLGGGGGATMAWGSRKFQVDVRYLSGLRAIMANTRSKNRGFTLGIGYLIPIGTH